MPLDGRLAPSHRRRSESCWSPSVAPAVPTKRHAGDGSAMVDLKQQIIQWLLYNGCYGYYGYYGYYPMIYCGYYGYYGYYAYHPMVVMVIIQWCSCPKNLLNGWKSMGNPRRETSWNYGYYPMFIMVVTTHIECICWMVLIISYNMYNWYWMANKQWHWIISVW